MTSSSRRAFSASLLAIATALASSPAHAAPGDRRGDRGEGRRGDGDDGRRGGDGQSNNEGGERTWRREGGGGEQRRRGDRSELRGGPREGGPRPEFQRNEGGDGWAGVRNEAEQRMRRQQQPRREQNQPRPDFQRREQINQARFGGGDNQRRAGGESPRIEGRNDRRAIDRRAFMRGDGRPGDGDNNRRGDQQSARRDDNRRGERGRPWDGRGGDRRWADSRREDRQRIDFTRNHGSRHDWGRNYDWDRRYVRPIRTASYFSISYVNVCSRYYRRPCRWYGTGWYGPWARPWRVGYVLPYNCWYDPIPYDLYYDLPSCPYGYDYVRVSTGDIILISLLTGLVIDALLFY